MASKPGPLTRWPWHDLGNYKYALVAPWAAYSTYSFAAAKLRGEEGDLLSFFVLPTVLLRLLYTQLWISISRYQTARSKHRIINKSLDFDQVDRERNWDDQIILTALLYYVVNSVVPMTQGLPWWNSGGLLMTALLHLGPVEFLYYWIHRALHHHYLYSRYHSHHHASIVTEPVTSVIHPFAEEAVYYGLFAIPLLTMMATGTGSVAVANGYLIYIDFMNYLGHCNFELVPKALFDLFPPLKLLMYTPSFHSLHHTQFRTNYSLFVPFYDYVYGTMDKSSEDLYERTLHGVREEAPDVVHHTHLTAPGSLLHLRLGFASHASAPLVSGSALAVAAVLERPLAVLASVFGRTAIRSAPRYTSQYMSKKDGYAVSRLLLLLLFGLLVGASHGAVPGVQTGTATWSGPADSARKDYTAVCLFGETVLTAPFNKMVTGFGGADECGVCYKVICNGHPACSVEGVTVTVTDFCRDPDSLCFLNPLTPENRPHFDMGGYAFGAMALPGRADELRGATGAGPLNVTFEWTNCIYARPNDSVVYPAFRPYPDATVDKFTVVLIYTEWSAFWPTVHVRIKSAGDAQWRDMQHYAGQAWAAQDDQKNYFRVTPPLSFQVDSMPIGRTEVKTVTFADIIPAPRWEIGKIYYGHA